MKKLLIELTQTFEIQLEEEDLAEMCSLGIDINDLDRVYCYFEDEIEEVIDQELDIYTNSWISLEDEC